MPSRSSGLDRFGPLPTRPGIASENPTTEVSQFTQPVVSGRSTSTALHHSMAAVSTVSNARGSPHRLGPAPDRPIRAHQRVPVDTARTAGRGHPAADLSTMSGTGQAIVGGCRWRPSENFLYSVKAPGCAGREKARHARRPVPPPRPHLGPGHVHRHPGDPRGGGGQALVAVPGTRVGPGGGPGPVPAGLPGPHRQRPGDRHGAVGQRLPAGPLDPGAGRLRPPRPAVGGG